MKKISLKKLLKLNNPIIYDIRDKNEFINKHIDNSINVNFNTIYITYSTFLNKFDTYYIVCEKGYRSKQIVKKLFKEGYNVIYVKKGLKNLNKYIS